MLKLIRKLLGIKTFSELKRGDKFYAYWKGNKSIVEYEIEVISRSCYHNNYLLLLTTTGNSFSFRKNKVVVHTCAVLSTSKNVLRLAKWIY